MILPHPVAPPAPAARAIAAPPSRIQLVDEQTTLKLDWPDGARHRLAATRLRACCRCAGCTAARRQRRAEAVPAGLTISMVTQVGTYALNIRFSDGHARGIFPWSYLRAIATEAPISDLLERTFQ
jgi:DUF971 family protein